MAERLTILCLGDLTAVGTRPVSELTAINAALDDAQADCDIWNIQTQAWAALQPGVNTNTYATANDKWSFESRLREALRTKIPTGKLYVVKYAADSTLLQYGTKPAWDPISSSGMYAGLVTQLTAAAAAANGAGDTLKIVGIVSSIMTDDWKQTSLAREFFDVYLNLIESVRVKTQSIPHCSSGSLSGSGQIPVVLVAPHYNWDAPYIGLDFEEGILHSIRMKTEMLEQLNDNIQVLRTHGQTTDQKGFSANSILAVAERAAALFYPPEAPDESLLPVEDMVMVFGDSIAEGTGANAQLPAYLTQPIVGVRIWNGYLASNNNPINPGPATAGALQTLHVGQNNNTSILPYLFPFHGPEPYLADQLRPILGSFTIVKGAIPGTLSTATTRPSSTSFLPPHLDRQIVHWDPSTRGQLTDLFIRGWMRSAVSAIRMGGKKPRARLVVLSLGSNDIIQNIYPERTGRAVAEIIAVIKETLEKDFVDTSLLKFSVSIPRNSLLGQFDTTEEGLAAVRTSLTSLAQSDPTVTVVDFDQFESFDNIHLDSANTSLWVTQAIQAITATASTQYKIHPLFVPSGASLRAALRLSQVPEGNDGSALIDTAVEAAKVGFFRILGPEKVAALKAIPYTTNPTTSQDVLRALAANTEVKWVRSQLLRTMPTLFMDGSSVMQTWNDEAAFRQGSVLQTRDELKRLQIEIDSALETLKTSVLSATGGAELSLVQPDNTIAPGDTVLDVF